MSRVVDPQKFRAKGGLIDWATWGRTHGMKESAAEIAERRKTSPWVIQLRWAFEASLGYPITPFTVWARAPHPDKQPVDFTNTAFGLILDGSYVDLWLDVTCPLPGVFMAYPGMPLATGPFDVKAVSAGTTMVRLSGPELRVLTISPGCTVNSIVGLKAETQDDAAWKPIEIVGIPSDGQASTFTDLVSPQGMLSAPTTPEAAALDRFNRGAPFFGWDQQLAAGPAVPPWVLADPMAMIKVFNSEMLPDFIDMCDNPQPAHPALPSHQHLKEYRRSLEADPQHAATATFNPLRTMLYGGVSDPLVSLIVGLGTAYPWNVLRETNLAQPTMVARAATTTLVPDFMVTATFVEDLGHKTERAALILGPGPVTPPPPPAAMAASSSGVQAPAALDGDYRSVVTVSWDTPPELFPFDVGSHALARRATSPVGPVELVMDPRLLDVALQPLGASRNAGDPNRRSLSDSTWPMDSTVDPNSLRYAVASQNIFGLWSPWLEAAVDLHEPPVSPVTVTAAWMETITSPGPCAAQMTLDLTWNWSSRRPQTITLVGRRYGQTWPSDPPGNTTPPLGNTFVSAGEGILATLSFGLNGDITAVTPGTGLSAGAIHLTVDGQHVSAVPLSDRAPRRYRVTIGGFSLDFNAHGRWGVALWARGVERRFPNRIGNFGSATVVSAADPRPPVINTVYDNVTLTSLRDGDGLHHAKLSWSPMAGSVAYQVYTCSEASFRAFHNQPEPLQSATLTQRLFQLQQLFGANPERRPFTRVGTDPVTGTSLQVTLPRGTKEIHMYVVIGVSAGGIESAWPTVADPLCGKRFTGIAAPTTVVPGAPALEVSRGDNGGTPAVFDARVRITSVPGAEVGKIELYRVRVPGAAAEVGTMGPPILSLTGSGGGWTVTPITSPGTNPSDGGVAQPLGLITGTDHVSGSWKPVFYRAVAWGKDDPTRGQYGARSAPSTPRSVVVPPSTPPALGSPSYVLPTPGSVDARIDFSTAVPIADTVLGPHRLEAEVLTTTPAGVVTRITVLPGLVAPPPAGDPDPEANRLSALTTSTPGAGKSGMWRDATVSETTPLHLLVRRTNPDDTMQVRIRITDPLGRITEKLIEVPAIIPDPPPDIVNPVVKALAHGWFLSFLTHAANTTDDGPVTLTVSFKPKIGTKETAQVHLADLPKPPLEPDTALAAAAPPIPMFATAREHGSRTIGIGVRTAVTLTVTLTTAGGAKTTITRTIGRRIFS